MTYTDRIYTFPNFVTALNVSRKIQALLIISTSILNTFIFYTLNPEGFNGLVPGYWKGRLVRHFCQFPKKILL